jgi:UDP-2,3-diacylglucosamine pyrophosphatase LpxH
MRVVLLSDAHLRGPGDPNQRRLLAFLAGLRCDRLVLLGDVFHHWWHFGDEPFDAYRPVVDALVGFDLVFVPGNHDFHAGDWLARHRGARVGERLGESWDGLSVHLAHGDEVDRSVGYRAASAVLRSPMFDAAMQALGPERAWRVLGRIAGAPGGAPNAALVEAQRALASSLDADLVVFGHTHAPCLEDTPRGKWANLGDWVTHHTWLEVADGVPALRRG